MKLPNFGNIPRPAAISFGVIAAAVILFGVLSQTLASSRNAAVAQNAKLKSTFAQSLKDIRQANDDNKFVAENLTRFEDLLKGERLVAHTPRDAVRQIQTLALQRGLTSLSYDFSTAPEKSAITAASQAKTDAYRVNVELITLKVGAPLDGQVYNFVLDMQHNFPGSAVLQALELQRPAKVTGSMLDILSKGQDAGLVGGTVRLLWRTAQANEQPGKKAP